jgi:hypothetical protein
VHVCRHPLPTSHHERRSSGPKPAPPGTNIPQSRESLPQKDDLLLLPPMIRPWGKGSGLRSAAPCLMGRGRVRRVRLIGPARNRCRLGFATCSSPGERGMIRAMTTSAWMRFGGGRLRMTPRAPGRTESYREFEIHCGRRAVTTTYSSSALQAGIDYLRALGSRADEISILGPDTVAWRGARFVAVPVLVPRRDER